MFVILFTIRVCLNNIIRVCFFVYYHKLVFDNYHNDLFDCFSCFFIRVCLRSVLLLL